MKNTPINVLADTGDSPQLLASAIESVADSAQKLLESPLTRRAITVLIKDSIGPGVTMQQIDQVLNAAANLKKRYVRVEV